MSTTPHPRLALLLCVPLAFAVSLAVGAEKEKKEDDAGALPLSRVVMFSSGVGFFEHAGDVEGDAKVDLKFDVGNINDLLKSMVLQDFGGGKISTVNYASQDPISRTLKSFAIDLTKNPTMADLLKQIRGEKVQVEAPNAVTGSIVGVETRKVRVKDEWQEVDYMTLLTDDGLRSLPLDQIVNIKLLDEKLNRELQQALKTLAMGHDVDKKTVTLNFLGQGKRPVRVGYVQNAPVWKTSYRLVLDDEKQPFLQGWAIVENTTEQDWTDVNLTLVSGRPISFAMDLYRPLYVDRPVVVPELFASLRPQVYDQDLDKKEGDFAASGNRYATTRGPRDNLALGRGAGGGFGGGSFGYAKSGEQSESGAPLADKYAYGVNGPGPGVTLDASHGGQSMAQAGDVGELFQYTIATPVTLPRQQSAMLPIVNDSVKGEKISIYNPGVHAKHPLNGLRLTNSTDLHLMQGPVTVFDGGAYAGDARIEDLQPGTERLISYAMDLDTEVAPTMKPEAEQLVSVRLAKGTLFTDRKLSRKMNYTVKNSGGKTKKILVEYPHDESWKLKAPKEPTEKTRNIYRFLVEAEPGKPAKLEIAEEQTVKQQWAVSNLDHNTILFYINAKAVSPEVKKALEEVVKRKQALQQIAIERQTLEKEIETIEREQTRIRQNMAQLDRNSDLYSRYVKMFGQQEDKVGKAREDIKALQEKETKAQKDLDDYLLNLDVA